MHYKNENIANFMYLQENSSTQVHIVNNDHRNNLGKFQKVSPFYFEYLNNEVGPTCPLKSMVTSILLKIGMVKLLKNLHTVLIVKNHIFQGKY